MAVERNPERHRRTEDLVQEDLDVQDAALPAEFKERFPIRSRREIEVEFPNKWLATLATRVDELVSVCDGRSACHRSGSPSIGTTHRSHAGRVAATLLSIHLFQLSAEADEKALSIARPARRSPVDVMTIHSAQLRALRDGRFAVEAVLNEGTSALLLVTATSPRTTLLPSLVGTLALPQIKTPTPIRGRLVPSICSSAGVAIGDYRLPEVVAAAHNAAGQFGVQGILGTEWLVDRFRVCINQRSLQLEMHVDPWATAQRISRSPSLRRDTFNRRLRMIESQRPLCPGSGQWRRAEQLVERLEEEVLAPHHALVHAQALALVVHAVLEDAFPAGRVDREELRRQECGQDRRRVVAVERAAAPGRRSARPGGAARWRRSPRPSSRRAGPGSARPSRWAARRAPACARCRSRAHASAVSRKRASRVKQ